LVSRGFIAQRILILIPHPDDEVVGGCGAISQVRAAGATVKGVYLTTGVPGPETAWPWQRGRYRLRVARRRHEAERAAQLIGLEPIFWQEVPARRLKDHLPRTRELLVRLLEETGSEVLWTPAYEGGHQDHDTASYLASTFQGQLPVWEFSEYNYSGGRVRSQEFIARSGQDRVLLLDTEERNRKRSALATYRSERGNLRHIQVHREVLRPLIRYDYTRPPHPGTLFYQRFQWVVQHPRVDSTRPEEVCRAFRAFATR
jgi:LmbE family N-acetylglucosaminyl deacetylase